jgi:pimeloyl-ACP methyl ester carboxylesterase
MPARSASAPAPTLSFDDAGSGAPVVLLHPFPFDRRFWADLARRLATTRRVIVPDLRGFGRTPLAGDFSIADLADDLAALLDHLGLARAHVGGLSMGGYVALAFAARHPHRLAGLLLADTKAGPDTEAARAARAEAIALVDEGGVPAYVERQLPRLVAPAALARTADELRRLCGQPAATVKAGLCALRDRPDRTPDLAAITCPTLVVVGQEDVLTPPSEAALMVSRIPGSRLVELPGVGHLPPLEEPEAFARAVLPFLSPASA